MSRFATFFHLSNDSVLFRSREELIEAGYELVNGNVFALFGADGTVIDEQVPLYEAKLIHQFDHRYASFKEVVKPTVTTPDEHANFDFVTSPRYWVPSEQVDTRTDRPAFRHGWLITYRDIARSTDARTFIASFFPKFGAANHVIGFEESGAELSACFLGSVNSFVFDFVVRQKVGGTHLNFFVVKQLPVLPPDTYTQDLLDEIVPRVLELTYTAHDMVPFARDLGYEGEPFIWDEERRAQLRADLDGIYAHLYGISRDDFDYILETFPIVKRKDEAEFGEFRTKRLCLEAYDRFEHHPALVAARSVAEVT